MNGGIRYKAGILTLGGNKLNAGVPASGRSISKVSNAFLPRALTILTHHRINGIRFTTGMKRTGNHQADMPAALSIGNACKIGVHAKTPPGLSTFRQIKAMQKLQRRCRITREPTAMAMTCGVRGGSFS